VKTVAVNTTQSYDVVIGSGVLDSLGSRVADLLPRAKKACIVSDSHVWPLYGSRTQVLLEKAGFEVSSFVFPAGEASKCGATYLELLGALAQNQLTRTDCIVALGGGVVGDMAGFAAATYLRGIPFVQLPTTLLAAVDSSVGGKTAIDLPQGKNLAGAFYQPVLVLCDTDLLRTLPVDIFRDGCAEVIKYGILYDPALFAELTVQGMDFDREAVIARCVELKRDIVVQDELDTGLRRKLNLGHTIGHGAEALSDYALSHGKAVAIGTAIVARAAAACGICDKDACAAILHTLDRFGLPTSTDHTAQALYTAALSDKKRSGDMVSLILPRTIGDCIIHPMPISEIEAFVKAGL